MACSGLLFTSAQNTVAGKKLRLIFPNSRRQNSRRLTDIRGVERRQPPPEFSRTQTLRVHLTRADAKRRSRSFALHLARICSATIEYAMHLAQRCASLNEHRCSMRH